MRAVIIYTITGAELLVFSNAELNVRKNEKYNSIQNKSRLFDFSEGFKTLLKKLNPNVVHMNYEHHDNLTLLDLAICSCNHSGLINNLYDLCYSTTSTRSSHILKELRGYNLDVTLNPAEKLIKNSSNYDENTEKTCLFRGLEGITEFVIIHQNILNRLYRDTDNAEDVQKVIYTEDPDTKILPTTKEQIKILCDQKKEIIKYFNQNEISITPENVKLDYIHYETDLGVDSLLLERIFNGTSLDHKIPSIYHAFIRSSLLNKLKLYEVVGDGIKEPYLSIREILKYKRKNVRYISLENFKERHKTDFLWMKFNLTQRDIYSYYDDILADIYLYENGKLEVLINADTGLDGGKIRDIYLSKVFEILRERVLNEQTKYSMYLDRTIEFPSSNSFNTFTDYTKGNKLLALNFKYDHTTNNKVSKKKLEEIITGFGNSLRELPPSKKNYYELNLKLGEFISTNINDFLYILEEPYHKLFIQGNPSRWYNSLKAIYQNESDLERNIQLFFNYLHNADKKLTLTSGPIIEIRKSNIRTLSFYVRNVHSLHIYNSVLVFLEMFIDLFEKNAKIKKMKKVQLREGNVEINKEDQIMEDDIDESHEFDEYGIMGDGMDDQEDLLMEEEGEGETEEGEEAEEAEGGEEKAQGETPEVANAGAGAGPEPVGAEGEATVVAEEDDPYKDIDPDNINHKKYLIQRLETREPTLFSFKRDVDDKASAVYSRMCPASANRQPVILNEREFNDIIANYGGSFGFKDTVQGHEGKITIEDLRSDKLTFDQKKEAMEDFFVFTKVRGRTHYYICPKYWCIIENRPMTEEEIIAGECGGKIVDRSAKPAANFKKVNKDRYILARDGRENYFKYSKNDPEEERAKKRADPNYKMKPEITFDEEVPGVAGFLKKKHPEYGRKLDVGCLPCCFKYTASKGLDGTMKKRKKSCHDEFAPPEAEQGQAVADTPPKDDGGGEYIQKKKSFALKDGSTSTIPQKMSNFIFHEKTCLGPSSRLERNVPGCMFRKGVDMTKEPLFNMFRKIRNASSPDRDHVTLDQFKEQIVASYTFERFVSYVKGTLVDTFSQETQDTREQLLRKIRDVGGQEVSEDTLEKIANTEEEQNRYLFSYLQFLEYIRDTREVKNIDYFLELFSSNDIFTDEKGSKKNIISNLSENINIVVFEFIVSGLETSIFIRCPLFGRLPYYPNSRTLLIYKYKNKYQPLFIKTHSSGDHYLLNLDELRANLDDDKLPSSSRNHLYNLIDSIKFSLDRYNYQCMPKYGESQSFDPIKYFTEGEGANGEYKLKKVFKAKDNQIQFIELQKSRGSPFILPIINREIPFSLLDDNSRIKIEPISAVSKQKASRVLGILPKFTDTLSPEGKVYFGFNKYVINEAKKVVGLLFSNGTILPVERQNMPTGISEKDVHHMFNVEDFLEYIYLDDYRKGEDLLDEQKVFMLEMEFMLYIIGEKYEASKKEELEQSGLIMGIDDYIEKNYEDMLEFIRENSEQAVEEQVPPSILLKPKREIMKDERDYFLTSQGKLKIYNFYGMKNQEEPKTYDEVTGLLTELVLTTLYSNDDMRTMVVNNIYKYQDSYFEFDKTIVLTETQLQNLINQNLKRVQSNYIQREHHYEMVNLEKLRNNVIQSFYGNYLEAKPLQYSDVASNAKGADWGKIFPGKLVLIHGNKERDGWKAIAFALYQHTDVDMIKQDYIKRLVEYLRSPKYDLDKMAKDLKEDDYKQNRDQERTKQSQYALLANYDEDQWEEALELIIGARGYYISHFDLKNIARLYNRNILLLRNPVIALKSNKTFNFGSHYVYKAKEGRETPDETIMLVSYKIPLEKNYFSITNILSYDEDEQDEEKIYKPFVPNKYLETGNTTWVEKYRNWTKAGGNKEIKVYKI
jgi:hypothetical protein